MIEKPFIRLGLSFAVWFIANILDGIQLKITGLGQVYPLLDELGLTIWSFQKI